MSDLDFDPEKSDVEDMSDYDPLTRADDFFLEEWPIHPMVAVFIALPIYGTSSDIMYTYNQRMVQISSNPFPMPDRDLAINLGLPGGLQARKLLLYFFSRFYQDDYFVLHTRIESKDCINEFGYHCRQYRYAHPLLIELRKLLYCNFEYSNVEFLEQSGYTTIKHIIHARRMLVFDYGRFKENDVTTIYLNPLFMFKTMFPVAFDMVLRSERKCEFWNIYLLLIDLLPRIPPRQKVQISWELLHDVFCRRYGSLANFKYFFRKQLTEVLQVYPQARGRVGTSQKHEVTFRNAPAPL